MGALKRYLVLGISATVGLAAAVGVASLTWPARPIAPPPGTRRDDWDSLAPVLEVCISFFAGTYVTGHWLARLLRADELAAEVGDTGRWHLGALLLLAGAVFILDHAFQVDRKGSAVEHWVMIGLGAVLIGLALWRFVRGPRRKEVAQEAPCDPGH